MGRVWMGSARWFTERLVTMLSSVLRSRSPPQDDDSDEGPGGSGAVTLWWPVVLFLLSRYPVVPQLQSMCVDMSRWRWLQSLRVLPGRTAIARQSCFNVLPHSPRMHTACRLECVYDTYDGGVSTGAAAADTPPPSFCTLQVGARERARSEFTR